MTNKKRNNYTNREHYILAAIALLDPLNIKIYRKSYILEDAENRRKDTRRGVMTRFENFMAIINNTNFDTGDECYNIFRL